MIDWLTDYPRYRKMHALGWTSYFIQVTQTKQELTKGVFNLSVLDERSFKYGFVLAETIDGFGSLTDGKLTDGN